MPTVSVFIVAEESIPRVALRQLLETEPGLSVIAATDLESAAQQIRKQKPNVVLLHTGSPSAGVLSFIRCARPHSRVVVLAREADSFFVRAALSAGALGYVLVRGNVRDLFSGIRAVARGRRFLDPFLNDILVEFLLRAEKGHEQLSAREQQVLTMLAYGYTNQEIANKLAVSRKSVETYRARITTKLDLHSRAEMVRYALATGLLKTDESPEDQDNS